MSAQPEEKLILFVDIRVGMAEMREWEPERILDFFRGIAAAVKATREIDEATR